MELHVLKSKLRLLDRQLKAAGSIDPAYETLEEILEMVKEDGEGNE